MTETDIQRYAREIAAVDLTTFDLSHPTTTEYRLAHEVVRLREENDRLQGVLNHVNGVGGWCQECEDTYAFLVDENAKRKAILAALREPSEKVLLAAVEAVSYGASYAALTRCIPAAVAAAEKEVANGHV